MDLASVVAALASVSVRVSGSTPNNNVQGDSSRACPTGLAGPEPSGTINDPGQHFHRSVVLKMYCRLTKLHFAILNPPPPQCPLQGAACHSLTLTLTPTLTLPFRMLQPMVYMKSM